MSESLVVFWAFSFDSLSNIMLILVCSVSTIVVFYSFNYMEGDPYLSKFISYISLFTFFMIILITSSNLCIFLAG
jgi:NADH:ubiquinone oxidoreductase subunit 5 (subunit L)/multisubunit Na+/H+ antiporter MnhA subunit